MDWLQPTATWYLTTTLITLAIAPLVMTLFATVTDRGASVARPVGALLAVWPAWMLASLGIASFGRTTLLLTLAAFAVVSWALALRVGTITRGALRHVGLIEAVHLGVFSACVWLRGFVPAVAGPPAFDQEKPSDLMMLASTMRAESMPPLDAWLSGEVLNYYYIGYVVWAAPAVIAGVTPAVAYNLAIASTLAATIVVAGGTTANILSRFARPSRARIGGALAAVFVALIGNPWAAWTALSDLSGQWRAWAFDGIFWRATRFMVDTPDIENDPEPIAEFPAFSFLLADLHPHLLALPFALTALALAWLFASMPRDETTTFTRLGALALTGLCVVGLYGINSWDFPIWFLVVALALLVSPALPTLGAKLIALGTVLLTGIAAWLPFVLNFHAPVSTSDSGPFRALESLPVVGGVLASIVVYDQDRTSPQEYLSAFGFFYIVMIALIGTELLAHREVDTDPLVTRVMWVSGILLVLVGLLLPMPLLILLGLPIMAGVTVLLRSTNLTLGVIATALATLAFVLTLVPEFVYLLDIYGRRMNTVFKLYLQVWLLLAVATALGAIVLWQRSRRWRPGQGIVALVTVGIVALGLVFPVVASSQWLPARNAEGDWIGVDGLHHLDPASHEAIQWLWDNGTGDDVLLAAGGCEWYSEVGRPSAASGVPAVIGWEGHERQWHLGDDEILAQLPERVAAIESLYARPTDDVLDRYGVTLMLIGPTERNGSSGAAQGPNCAPGPFPEASSPEFPGPGWTEVFAEGEVRILRRDDG